MIKLYGNYGAASLAPRIVLEELGLAYEFIRIDTEKGEQRSAEYRKLNPNARIPTLVDGDLVLYESAAICLYLAEKVPDTGLLPAAATAGRAQLYKWLMFLTNTLQPAMVAYFYPERLSTEADDVDAIKAKAEQNALAIYRQLDAELAARGPFLLGNEPSIADFYLMMLVRWGRWLAEPPGATLSAIAALVDRLGQRPAVQRCFSLEGIPAPYCLLPA